LKDWLNAEGMSVHDSYLEISEGEFTETRDFVMERFRPMVEMAFEDLNHAEPLQAWTLDQVQGCGS